MAGNRPPDFQVPTSGSHCAPVAGVFLRGGPPEIEGHPIWFSRRHPRESYRMEQPPSGLPLLDSVLATHTHADGVHSERSEETRHDDPTALSRDLRDGTSVSARLSGSAWIPLASSLRNPRRAAPQYGLEKEAA